MEEDVGEPVHPAEDDVEPEIINSAEALRQPVDLDHGEDGHNDQERLLQAEPLCQGEEDRAHDEYERRMDEMPLFIIVILVPFQPGMGQPLPDNDHQD
jgi:hypothetical protein